MSKGNSLRNKMLIFLLPLMIIPIIISGNIWFQTSKSEIQNEQVNAAASNMKLLNNSISDLIQPKIHDVTYLATRLTEKSLSLKKNSDARIVLDQYVQEHTEVAMAYIGSTKGDMIRMPYFIYEKDYDPRERPWYIASQKASDVVITDPYVSSTSGDLVITVSKKLEDGSGVIGIDLSISKLADLAKDIQIGDKGFASIIDLQNKYIADDQAKGGEEVPANLAKIVSGVKGQVSDSTKIYLYETNSATGWKVLTTVYKDEATAAMLSSTIINLIVGFIIIVLASILIIYIVRSITRPLQHMSEQAKKIKNGDLQVTIDVANKDEIGALASSLTSMKDNLASLVKDIQVNTNHVMQTTNDVNEQIQQNMVSIEDVAKAMNDVTVTTETQANDIQTASTSVNEVTIGTTEIAHTISDVADFSQTTLQHAQAGETSIEQAVNQMHHIKESVHTSNTQIHDLYTHTTEIGRILLMMKDIADQTNLLALNASIEAARAGEHGKGFAVVAEEVRKLAESSQQSANEISTLIQVIQTSTKQSVDQMSSTMHTVDEGVAVTEEAKERFSYIMTNMEQMTPKLEGISATTEEMASVTEQLANTTEHLTGYAQSTNAMTEEVTASAQTSLHAMDTMSEDMKKLVQLSEELQRHISKFTI